MVDVLRHREVLDKEMASTSYEMDESEADDVEETDEYDKLLQQKEEERVVYFSYATFCFLSISKV